MAEPIEGLPTELIDRLIKLLDDDLVWEENTNKVVASLGGETLAGMMPETGRSYEPGTLGYMRRQESTVVPRQEWIDAIRDRLATLVLGGVSEAFLTRALRDDIERFHEHAADVAGANARRSAAREGLDEALDRGLDRERLDRQRELWRSGHPDEPMISDDELVEQLRRLAGSSILDPVSADYAASRWAALDRWRQRSAELLPDEIVDDWVVQSLRRSF